MLNPNEYNLSRSDWEHLIDEYIFSERDRKIVKRKLLDDITFERLAEEFELSDRHTKNIIYNANNQLLKCIKTSQNLH